MTLHQLIRDLIKEQPKAKPATLAKTLISRTGRDTLVQVLAEEIAHVQRHEVRSVERAAFDEIFSPGVCTKSTTSKSTPTAADLYRERFALGDGTSVTWGRATIEQHQQRIAMLEKLQAGIAATIERHRTAIRTIESAGATCLEDIKQAA